MPDLSHLDTLVDLFPSVPCSELASRLLCASSVETLIEELIREQNGQQTANSSISQENGSGPGRKSKVYSANVLALKELFPTVALDVLAATLQKHHNSLERATEALVDTDVAGRLSLITGLLPQLCKPYAEKHASVLVALADVIGSHGKSGTVWTLLDVAPDKEDVRDLNEYVWGEPQLQRLNYDFLEKTLAVVHGNVFRVLEIARMYLEEDACSLTYERQYGFVAWTVPPQNSLWKPLSTPRFVWKPIVPKSELRQTVPARVASPSTATRLPTPSTKQVDLHGLPVAEAKSVARAAAQDWWAEELEQRVHHGRMERYGKKAVFVEPLNVVTGRGIHLTGGVAKIRTAVVKMFRSEGFLIDEQAGSVLVYGKS